MLLTHTSGLAWPSAEDKIPHIWHFYTNDEGPPLDTWLRDYILPDGSQYREAVWKNYPPGEKQLYSNIGTSLLALVVENITGKDYRDYCREHIFEPLEMYQTGFRFSNINEELLATPYWDDGRAMEPFNHLYYPAGSIKTNIEDFSHFVIAFLNQGTYHDKSILKPSTVDKMFSLQNPSTGVAFLWYWGCFGKCIGHNGGGTGFRTNAQWFPDLDKGLFIFSNIDNEEVVQGGRIYELVRYQLEKY